MISISPSTSCFYIITTYAQLPPLYASLPLLSDQFQPNRQSLPLSFPITPTTQRHPQTHPPSPTYLSHTSPYPSSPPPPPPLPRSIFLLAHSLHSLFFLVHDSAVRHVPLRLPRTTTSAPRVFVGRAAGPHRVVLWLKERLGVRFACWMEDGRDARGG